MWSCVPPASRRRAARRPGAQSGASTRPESTRRLPCASAGTGTWSWIARSATRAARPARLRRNAQGRCHGRHAVRAVLSASKAVTAMVTHLLDERGVLRLDDAVAEYVPSFDKHGKRWVRIRHVLTHRAGLPSVPGSIDDPEVLLDPEECVKRLCDARPVHAPGRRLAYHALTGGYLFGAVVRQATGKTLQAPCSKLYRFEQWLRDDVFLQGFEKLELQHLYRSMAVLEEHKLEVEKAVYFAMADLMNADVDSTGPKRPVRQRTGDLRLPWLHAVLAANAQGGLVTGHEDTQGEASEGAQGPRRALPTPSARLAHGAARRGHEAYSGAHELLRGQRQHARHQLPGRRGRGDKAQVAQPLKSAKTPQLEAVQGPPRGLSASRAAYPCPDMGIVNMSLLSGRAVWWKSPSTAPRGDRWATTGPTRQQLRHDKPAETCGGRS